MNTILARRLIATTMASAAILAGAGFTALGSIFNYPKILQDPAADILASYRQHDLAISAWFLVLVLSAALLAPAGVGLGRLGGGRIGKWIAHQAAGRRQHPAAGSGKITFEPTG